VVARRNYRSARLVLGRSQRELFRLRDVHSCSYFTTVQHHPTLHRVP
jgi:hypothetical protein